MGSEIDRGFISKDELALKITFEIQETYATSKEEIAVGSWANMYCVPAYSIRIIETVSIGFLLML